MFRLFFQKGYFPRIVVYTIKYWIAHCPIYGSLNKFMEFQFLIQEHGCKISIVVNIYIYIYTKMALTLGGLKRCFVGLLYIKSMHKTYIIFLGL